MATTNRSLQRSLRPIRSEYRVYRDWDTGRTIYTPFNDLGVWDIIEFVCNVCTCLLLSYTVALFIPAVNSCWPLFGAIWVGLCFWQNESITRWPLRFIAWGLFWGLIAIT